MILRCSRNERLIIGYVVSNHVYVSRMHQHSLEPPWNPRVVRI
jgi:hypothetical protein